MARSSPTPADFPAALTVVSIQDDIQSDVNAARIQRDQQAPYRVLGWDEGRTCIYYQDRALGQIASFKPAATASAFLPLAPNDYWCALFPANKEATRADWTLALDHVIEQGKRAGIFSPDRVRGRGVYYDPLTDEVIWHMGDRLEINGVLTSIGEARLKHHYARLSPLNVDPSASPLSNQHGAEILEAVRSMGWLTNLDHIHLLGWIVLANVSAALEKRPALSLTSHFGSGKSATVERVMEPLLPNAISESNATEAAIRQTLRDDTLPVIIDESEQENTRRREGHVMLARLSYDGKHTSRGTPGGKALSYAVRSSIALVGINANITTGADRSRTVVVGRVQLPLEQWVNVQADIERLITPKTGQALLRRCVSNTRVLRHNISVFRRIVEGLGSRARDGDTYGPLLAGAFLLCSVEQLTDDAALAWLDSIGWEATDAVTHGGEDDANATSPAAESLACLEHILGYEETWRSDDPTGRITTRELITMARKPSASEDVCNARKVLGRRGIRVSDACLQITTNPIPLASILGKTKWGDGNHRNRLRDLPGATSPKAPIHFPSYKTERTIEIPWEVVGLPD